MVVRILDRFLEFSNSFRSTLSLHVESVIKHAVGYIFACFDAAGMKCFSPTNENPVDNLQTSM